MKLENAVQHLRTLMLMIQRFRGQAQDQIIVPDDQLTGTGLDITERIMEDLMPWIFGEKCILPSLERVLSQYDKTGELQPIDYYNMMYILDQFMSELKAFHLVFDGELPRPSRIPDEPPSIQIMSGWD